MDQSALVTEQINGGRHLIGRLLAAGVPVEAAAWLKDNEEGRWRLYVASPKVDEIGKREAYGLVHAAFAKPGSRGISQFDVHLVGVDEPLARELIHMYDRGMFGLMAADSTGVWFVGPRLGGMSINDAYIYPTALLKNSSGQIMTTDEVLRKVTDLLNQTGVKQPSTISLRDNTAFQGVPYGLEVSNGVLTLKFVDASSKEPRVVPATDVASIA